MAQPSKERVRANTNVHDDDIEYNDDIEVGRRVLRIEAAGLEALGSVLDESFITALDILASVEDQGRVIVTGMGKSTPKFFSQSCLCAFVTRSTRALV